MIRSQDIVSLVAASQDLDQFQKENWIGSFEEYLDLIQQNPRITRNAFERIFDMISSYGVEDYEKAREKRLHYKFFDDPR